MKQYFKDVCYAGYYYETDDNNVYSTKRPGAPHKMTWTRSRPSKVTLSTLDGIVPIALTHCELLAYYLAPLGTGPVQSTNKVSAAPTFPYVLFSTVDKCSQYFPAGTSIETALAVFAKRKIIIDPKNVQILNTLAGEVVALTVKVTVVETVAYNLN